MDREDEAGLAVRSDEATSHEASEAPVLLELRDRLRYIKTLLPRQVRLLVPTSPLAGQEVVAERAVRRNGTIWLTVVVADGTERSVEVENTNLVDEAPQVTGSVTPCTVTVEALRELKRLTVMLASRVHSGEELSSREQRRR